MANSKEKISSKQKVELSKEKIKDDVAELKLKGKEIWKNTAGFLSKASSFASQMAGKVKETEGYKKAAGYVDKAGDKLEQKLPKDVSGGATKLWGKFKELSAKGAKQAKSFLEEQAKEKKEPSKCTEKKRGRKK